MIDVVLVTLLNWLYAHHKAEDELIGSVTVKLRAVEQHLRAAVAAEGALGKGSAGLGTSRWQRLARADFIFPIELVPRDQHNPRGGNTKRNKQGGLGTVRMFISFGE